jgi:hypothetical protein
LIEEDTSPYQEIDFIEDDIIEEVDAELKKNIFVNSVMILNLFINLDK